jgi:hypothetical protein
MDSPALRARALLVCLLACTIVVAPASVPATPSDTHSSLSVAPLTAASHGADEPTTDSDRPLLTDISLQQAQEANTLTIVSTSDERVYYNTTVGSSRLCLP